MSTALRFGLAPRIRLVFGGGSANGGVLRAAMLVTGAGMVVKLAATGKEMVVAGIYGRSDAMDAFLAAALIPGLLVNLIAESMNQALIPTLIRVREREGQERAQELLSSSMLWMGGMLGAASIGMALAAHAVFPLIAADFSASKLALSIRLFYLLLPTVLLAGVAANCTAVLNTFDRFAWPALAPLAVPIAIVAAVGLFGIRRGIWAIAYGTLAGTMLQAVLVAAIMEVSGYKFRARWHGMTEAAREVTRQYGAVLLSSVVASGGLLVDQSMAATLPAGSLSALVYGNRFVSVAVALLGGAVSTAVTPHFSRMIAKRDWRGCRQTLRVWVGITAAVSIPVTAGLILGARMVVRLAFQHGAFGPRDTSVVASVMAMYAVQIPFFVVSRVFYRFIIAMRRSDLALFCGMLNLILDIVLNLVLMRRLGVAGIALATSLWTMSTFFFLRYWAGKLLPADET